MFFDELEKKSTAGWSWQKHPTSAWYEWTSGKFWYEKWSKKKVKVFDWEFTAWDREKWEEFSHNLSEMPKEFIVISESWKLWGYVQSKKKPVWWPEVYDLTTEPLVAMIGKEPYFKWIWSTFKDRRKDLWVELFRNLHCFDVNDPSKFFTFSIKWKASFEWSDTFKDDAYGYLSKVISFGDEKEFHNGDTDYTVPTYKIGRPMTDEERAKRNEFMQMLREYHESVTGKSMENGTEEKIPDVSTVWVEVEVPPVDELPF